VGVADSRPSRRPKYRQLRDALASMIDDLPPGSVMPTERELCERFSVARGTVRQALNLLEVEQRIYRHQGKGTFATPPKIDQMLELVSHTEHIRARGMDPSSKVLSISSVPADGRTALLFDVQEGEEMLQIERVRLADGEPLAVELLLLHAPSFPGIADALSTRSLYDVLRHRYGVELSFAEETIEVAVSAEREADLLGVSAGAPVLVLCRHTFDATGRPVEYVRSHYRADRFRFRTRLHPATQGDHSLPPDLQLRLAGPEDARGLARVFIAAWHAGYPGIVRQEVLDALDEDETADWLGSLTARNGLTTWLVQSQAGTVLAFSRHGEDPADSRRGHIYSLYVHPDAGGRGVGSALLEHGLRLLAHRGLDTVTLWVFEGNEAARRLYASFGFTPDGARRVEPEYGAQEVRLRRSTGAQREERR
jgi:GntR family transcriptional regulator